MNNETDVTAYDHDILRPPRVHELITRVRQTERAGRRLLVGISYGGGSVPKENVVRTADFLLLHGNGVNDPVRIREMVRQTRAVPGYRPMPMLFNEDDHENFDQPTNNFTAALREHVSWGWFDFRRRGEGGEEGFQSPPVNWGLSSERKWAFFKLCAEITGGAKPVGLAAPPPGLKGLYQRQFGLGAAIPGDNLSAGEVDLLTRNFSSVTPENIMKPKFLQPAESRFDFDATDRFVAFAQRQQLAIHGHTLVWHRQSPDWIFRAGAKPAGREQVLQRSQTHIATAVGRYAGKVASRDVVNEAIDEGDNYLRPSPWFLTAGEDDIAAAFQAARRADPAARLYYNDFFWGLHDGKSWLNYTPRRHTNHPLLWSRELTPKPAFDAVRDVGAPDAVE